MSKEEYPTQKDVDEILEDLDKEINLNLNLLKKMKEKKMKLNKKQTDIFFKYLTSGKSHSLLSKNIMAWIEYFDVIDQLTLAQIKKLVECKAKIPVWISKMFSNDILPAGTR